MIELHLCDGPDLSPHCYEADGFVYTKDLGELRAPLPEAFLAPLPPWSTVVAGLESGRFGVRQRFMQAMTRAATDGEDLTRFGDALAAAFSSRFGGRGSSHNVDGFAKFIDDATATTYNASIRAQLARGRNKDKAPPAQWPELHAFGFALETGHWPADHESLLYWMTESLDACRDTYFRQADPTADDCDSFVVKAWHHGRQYTTCVRNLVDYYDAYSCAAFLNTLLERIGDDNRIFLSAQDEVGFCLVGEAQRLDALIASGALTTGDD